MGLMRDANPRELITITVPPCTDETRITVRSFMRTRRNGGPRHTVIVTAPLRCPIGREDIPVDGAGVVGPVGGGGE
jgi:hypothetical protein